MPEELKAIQRAKPENKLINSKTFCTNYAGEEYSIEETDYSAGKSGHSKQESTGNQWI